MQQKIPANLNGTAKIIFLYVPHSLYENCAAFIQSLGNYFKEMITKILSRASLMPLNCRLITFLPHSARS
jgi:hypothetical protein